MRQRLLNIVNELFDTEFAIGQEQEIKPDFIEKWDSMAHLNLIICIEDEFGIVLEPTEIAEMLKGFESIVNLLTQKGVG